MMLKKLVFLTALAFSAISHADVLSDIKPLQDRWAEVNYNLADKAKEQAFAELVAQADQVVASNPQTAEALIWRGIIKSSYAGAKGGLGALSLCEESKADLEKALELNPDALQGSAYTSLGALYFKVPGWPIGFGSDKKARQLLEKAVSLNPQGIDPNYFYAEFLTEEHDYKKAWDHLQTAKQAPARPDRLSADAGRQQEIAQLEQKLAKKLKKH